MPYLIQDRIEELKGQYKKREFKYPLSAGDLNAIFTLWMIEKWKEEPRYSTIHRLRHHSFVIDSNDAEFASLRYAVRAVGDISTSDIDTAYDLAFSEFYRRVAADYEDGKASTNGDLYAEVVEQIYEDQIRGK